MDPSRRNGLLRPVQRMMRRWVIAGMVTTALVLAFVFSTWAYQAHRDRITNDCITFLEEHPDIAGSCAAT